MPFRKVENCNQVVKIGKQLKFSLVNIAGNDIVQGNKKLILGKPVNFVTCYPEIITKDDFSYSGEDLWVSFQLICGNWCDTTSFNF